MPENKPVILKHAMKLLFLELRGESDWKKYNINYDSFKNSLPVSNEEIENDVRNK